MTCTGSARRGNKTGVASTEPGPPRSVQLLSARQKLGGRRRLPLSLFSVAVMDKKRLEKACKDGDHEVVLDICQKRPSAATHMFYDVHFPMPESDWLCLYGYNVTCLHIASAFGHVGCCRVLLDCGADVEAKDAYGRTPLMYAKTFEVVQLLLSRRANANTRDQQGWTALHHCAKFSLDKRCIGELVSASAKVTAEDNIWRTPLMVLIEYAIANLDLRKLDVGLELVKRGANANTTAYRGGITLLHRCVGKLRDCVGLEDHRSRIISELVQRGANLDARTAEGKTALHIATENNLKETVCQLIKLGANVNPIHKHGKNKMLRLSAETNHFEVSAKLISLGADANTSVEDGETALHCAAKAGYTDHIQELVKAGAGTEARDKHGNTPLLLAAENGHPETVCALSAAGAAIDACNGHGEQAVHLAAKNGHTQTFCGLVDAGASVDVCNKHGETAVHLAAKNGHTDTVVQLVASGAPFDSFDQMGCTPLVHAIQDGFTETAHELRKAGATLEAKDKDGNTCLHHAVKTNKHEHVKPLVKAGANVQALNHDGESALLLAAKLDSTVAAICLLQSGASIGKCSSGSITPLSVASKRGNGKLCCELVGYGAKIDDTISFFPCLSNAINAGDAHLLSRLLTISASINECDENGLSALHVALTSKHPELAEWIVKHGGKVSVADKLGQTPLHIAAANDHTSMASKLLVAGASAEVRDNNGITPLSVASKRGNGKLCCELVGYGAKIDDTISFFPCLSNAINAGDTHLLSRLLTIGASINECDENGSSALHVALTSKRPELAEWIIEHAFGGKVSVANELGQTPLHIAATNDYNSMASKLLEAGASAEVRDNIGITPLSVASTRGNGELCCELVRYGAEVDDTITFFTCLFNAIKAGDAHLLARLVGIGVSINERDRNGSTALHTALTFQRVEIATWIIEHGGDVSLPDAEGFTPLHCAAQMISSSISEKRNLIKLLLAKGADPTAETKHSQTALDIAEQRRDCTIVTVLEKAKLAHELVKQAGVSSLPDSVAVRLGGPPGAGKSTLANALQVTRVQGFFRYESQTDEGATNMHQRTKGIKCHNFVDESSSRFTIFDLGGKGEFLATHQVFIGDGSVPVIDCVVVSALDENLKNNVFKWSSLFASRNQPVAIPWPLLLVATRADKATQQQKNAVISIYLDAERAFSEHFMFPCSEPLFIDARKSWNELTIELRQVLNQLHQVLLDHGDSQRKPAICQRIEENLPELRRTRSSPVILKEQFIEFMLPHIGLRGQTDIVTPAVASLFDKALKYLSGYATVLSFSQSLAERYVVISPQWLLSDIVGRLMAEPPLPGPHVHYNNGYAKTSDVVVALETEHLPGREALEMVAGLGFCLEHKSTDTVLNPSKLRAHRLDEHWCRTAIMAVNAGRRLKCKGTVAIASAFFSHLQVHFYHRYLSDYDQRLPMWTGGIRLVPRQRSSVEAIIESDPSSRSIDIIVRGRQGSERDCSNLLHSLTEETLQKATEISPGSQLRLFFLSKLELDKLSPAGLPSRPLVEYSEERVLRAISHGECVIDGNAGLPEHPDDLLLPRPFAQRSKLHDELKAEPAEPLTQTLSTEE